MRGLAIIACVVGAIALGLAFSTFMEVSVYGFPDGHVTDYEKAVDAPLTILAWVEAGFGLLFLALAFTPIGHPGARRRIARRPDRVRPRRNGRDRTPGVGPGEARVASVVRQAVYPVWKLNYGRGRSPPEWPCWRAAS
jgi:hypothetical protein